MNSVILIGRLTKDPEVRYTASQMAVASFTLAIDRPTGKDGEKHADFPRITVFGKQAENCERYLSKGRMVAVQGRIQTGSYKDKDGKTVYTTDVVADRVRFLGSYDNSKVNNNNSADTDISAEMPDSFEAIEDDVPF